MAPRVRVTLSRNDPTDAGHRQILARIDDGPTVTLMMGDERTIDIAPGSHTLHANNTLVWKKVPFDAADGQAIRFSLVNVASRLSFGFLAGLGMAPMYLKIIEHRMIGSSNIESR